MFKKRKTTSMKELRGDHYIQDIALKYSVLTGLYVLLFLSVLVSWIGLPFENSAVFFALIPLFIWSYRWPNSMPSYMIFVIGLLTDIVMVLPLGITAFSILLVLFLVRLQQRFLNSQPFIAVWFDFMVLSFLYNVVFHGLGLITLGQFDIIWNVVQSMAISWVVMVLAFPPLSVIMNGLISMLHDANNKL